MSAETGTRRQSTSCSWSSCYRRQIHISTLLIMYDCSMCSSRVLRVRLEPLEATAAAWPRARGPSVPPRAVASVLFFHPIRCTTSSTVPGPILPQSPPPPYAKCIQALGFCASFVDRTKRLDARERSLGAFRSSFGALSALIRVFSHAPIRILWLILTMVHKTVIAAQHN